MWLRPLPVLLLVALMPLSARAGIASREESDDAPERQSSSSASTKPIELHLSVGAGGLTTTDHTADFHYDDGEQHPLRLSTKAGRIAPGGNLSIYFNLPALAFGRIQLSPYVSGDVLVGSLTGMRGTAGLRVMYTGGQFHPWIGVGGGYAQLSGEIAQVGAGELIAPDGSQVRAGESINATGTAVGAEARVGLNVALSDTWGLVAMLGFHAFSSITEWEAKTHDENGNEVSLGKLTGLPPAGISGPTAFVGVSYSYSQ